MVIPYAVISMSDVLNRSRAAVRTGPAGASRIRSAPHWSTPMAIGSSIVATAPFAITEESTAPSSPKATMTRDVDPATPGIDSTSERDPLVEAVLDHRPGEDEPADEEEDGARGEPGEDDGGRTRVVVDVGDVEEHAQGQGRERRRRHRDRLEGPVGHREAQDGDERLLRSGQGQVEQLDADEEDGAEQETEATPTDR